MLLHRMPPAVLGSNCYVIVPAGKQGALVVDPGAGAANGVVEFLKTNNLSLEAVLLTHGHADHCWDSAAVVAGMGQAQCPVYVPSPDLYRLDDPEATTGIYMRGRGFSALAGTPWRRPLNVVALPQRAYSDGVELISGLPVRAVAAPGHTEGSSLFLTVAQMDVSHELLAEAEVETSGTQLLALTGDVIFKGSVGRDDLPGGSHQDMLGSLRFLANAIDPSTVLLPGHGAATTMAHEHHANPYMHEAKTFGGELD